MKRMVCFLAACVMLVGCAWAEGKDNWLSGVLERREAPSERYVAMVSIDGEISEYDYYYDHVGTLEVIDSLMEDKDNAALLLLLNTPGGSLYEADELYHELMTYKQETGRPVIAYMEQECCSAGVMIAMAADTIMASRMTITGCIGVYMSSFSEAGLYEKLGLEQEYVSTGENKVSGYPTLTEEQRAVMQSLVDEGFAFFMDAVKENRNLTDEQTQGFVDGRMLTAAQAKEMGLIDEVCYYDEAISMMDELYGLADAEIVDMTPMWEEGYGAQEGFTDSLLDLFPEITDSKTGAQRSGRRLYRALYGL